MVVMAENSVYHKSNHNQDAPSDHFEGGNPAVTGKAPRWDSYHSSKIY